MRLTFAAIRANAIKFGAEWADVSNERAHAQAFWTDLLTHFGLKRKQRTSFEKDRLNSDHCCHRPTKPLTSLATSEIRSDARERAA